MDLRRISSVLDIERIRRTKVTVVGAGGNAGLLCDLTRCGVERFKIVDYDSVELPNLARQGHAFKHVGRPKVDAIAEMIHGINPAAVVEGYVADFMAFTSLELDFHFGGSDLYIFCTDRFKAQAFGNRLALRHGTPALWLGLYPGGQGGEAIFWHPDLAACYRCLCSYRYKAQEEAIAEGRKADPTSDGADIFAIHLLDSIGGMIALGLLTRGADNRYGRLIGQLGDRNFLQIKIDPAWTINGKDVVREQLGIRSDCPAYFAWNTIARSDPDHGLPPCPDCIEFRHREAKPAEPVPGKGEVPCPSLTRL